MSGFPQSAGELALALARTRGRTLALMDAWCAALPDLRVPQHPTLNLPLWEWGHVAWFQTWWIGRNRQRAWGRACEPDHERLPPFMRGADELFNSSTVPHASRWSLALPSLEAVKAELARSQQETLQLLQAAEQAGEDLYFWQLVLVHEAMHNEAALYMAQALSLPMPEPLTKGYSVPVCLGEPQGKERPLEPTVHRGQRSQGFPHPGPRRRIALPRQLYRLGHRGDASSFAFDNEWVAHEVSLDAFEVDDRPVSWGEYLAFAQDTGHPLPAAVRLESGLWLECRFGQWQSLDLDAPACWLSAHDAQAWCDWAGRALPTEAQWECAARSEAGLVWGQVWEWTASDFRPYPGFTPHPYRDYSAPWFGTHRVLRGASRFTDALLVSPSYRNFFLPQRTDIPAGFRTVSRAVG